MVLHFRYLENKCSWWGNFPDNLVRECNNYLDDMEILDQCILNIGPVLATDIICSSAQNLANIGLGSILVIDSEPILGLY